ncbi:tetratricopeptide repeat protein [Methylotuvimicrobium sp. KM1]|uniref:tetratricopeptide repeat protein n=1 Tax=Methylotuvimicrobium sp. KM1 TaxID=3377707 RepID=UPI00384BDC49
MSNDSPRIVIALLSQHTLKKKRMHDLTKLLFSALLLHGCHNVQVETVPLFDNLGDHRYPIATSSTAAQRYFDQGLILTYGFNHAEAARSFRQAYYLDPNCAMCYWGEALVLGPNINAPMDPSSAPQAYASVQKAMTLADSVSDKEKALIHALTKRYVKEAPADRVFLDEAYATAMREVAQRFPDDPVILSLFAEALMDLHPWDFWTNQGEAKPWTAEIISTLEQALAIDAYNPLANHLYIHALEASPFPEKALPSAQRLPSLVPSSGHLVHMPAHIYIRTGRYRDAILANQQAVKSDHGYLSHNHTESIYTLAYVPHNYHFLWAAAIKTGRKALATQAAADTASKVKPELLRTPGLDGTLQHFSLIPLYTLALFGEWETILKEPLPAADLLYPKGIWHYTRGLALLRTNQAEPARQELAQLEKILNDPAIAELKVFDLNPVASLLRIGSEILSSELAAESKDYDKATAHLKHAIELEDGLNYTEPKDWYLPPRQVLGAILLEADRPQEAELVYREDLRHHPQNGWSLFGLAQSLREQHKNREADEIDTQFRHVWAEADVELTGSRF